MGNVGTITPVKATNWETFYNENILGYFQNLKGNPFELITLIIDLAIVIFLFYWFFKAVKGIKSMATNQRNSIITSSNMDKRILKL